MPEIKRYCGGHTTMLLKKLKDFHERTMEQYKEEEILLRRYVRRKCRTKQSYHTRLPR